MRPVVTPENLRGVPLCYPPTPAARAFPERTGQLSPEDPYDEPASTLLVRIRAERKRAAPKRKAKRTSGRTVPA